MFDSDTTLTSEEIQRFKDKVKVSETKFCYRSLSYCHEWAAGKFPSGYGQFQLRGKPIRSHRLAYFLHYGAIPEGLCVLHRCDNRACVNTDHLWTGTNAENTRDKCEKGRQSKGETHGWYTKPESRPRGERHWKAKLKDAEIPEIFRMRIQGMSWQKIATVMGVSKKQIGNILQGKSRKQLNL